MSLPILQCSVCGRIRLDRAWGWLDCAIPDVMGFCPGCMRVMERQNRERYKRNALECRRKLLAYVPDPDAGLADLQGGK